MYFTKAETLVQHGIAATKVKIDFQNSPCGYHPDEEHREGKLFFKVTEQ